MRWTQLEGDPDILTEYFAELGGEGTFYDVPTLEGDVARAMVDGLDKCQAMVLVAPIEFLESLELESIAGKEPVHIKQTIDNACGAIALFHVLATMRNAKLTEQLSSLPNSASRGAWLETNDNLAEIHAKYSHKGQTDVPELEADTDLHFVAVIRMGDEAIWMDGRKEGPLRINGQGDFMDRVLASLQLGVEKSPEVAGKMAIFALCK